MKFRKKAITIGGIVGWIMTVIFAMKYDKAAVKSSKYRALAIRFSGVLKRNKELIQANGPSEYSYDNEICNEAETFYNEGFTV